MSYLLLVLGLILALWARAAVRTPRGGHPVWVVAMGAGELAGWLLIVCALALFGFRTAGWAGGPAGVAGQVLTGIAALGFGVAVVRGLRSGPAARKALGLDRGSGVVARPSAVVWPLSPLPRRAVSDIGLSYGPHDRHRVDRIAPASATGPRPALIHVHGGGWWRGRRSTQARPLLHLMVRSGWVVFTPSYRLSPEATFPDHLIDIKRVIAWIRENAAELSVDPGFIAVAGGSTGGNLAALAALTSGDTALQPGFEGADTSVQACIPLYGVHDLTAADGSPLWPYLADQVMKSTPASDPAAWRRVSPIAMARADRPPFLIVHGATDTLVEPSMSRRLVEALREVGGPPVGYFEVPWANHGFDFFAGPRGAVTARAIRTSLEQAYSAHAAAGEGGSWTR